MCFMLVIEAFGSVSRPYSKSVSRRPRRFLLRRSVFGHGFASMSRTEALRGPMRRPSKCLQVQFPVQHPQHGSGWRSAPFGTTTGDAACLARRRCRTGSREASDVA